MDGTQVVGTWRSHQVPLSGVRENQDHLRLLEEWMRSTGQRSCSTLVAHRSSWFGTLIRPTRSG